MMNFIAPQRQEKTATTGATPLEQPAKRLTEAEVAEMRRRRGGSRITLACEGMYLSPEDEALLESMDRERLTPEDRLARIEEVIRADIVAKATLGG